MTKTYSTPLGSVFVITDNNTVRLMTEGQVYACYYCRPQEILCIDNAQDFEQVEQALEKALRSEIV
jgi:hypothetical protein